MGRLQFRFSFNLTGAKDDFPAFVASPRDQFYWNALEEFLRF